MSNFAAQFSAPASRLLAAAGLAVAILSAGPAAAAPARALVAAVADPARPADERARDAIRKPVEVLTFAGIKPGDVIVERFPGNGYYTRLLSKAVGPRGKVYVTLGRRADGSVLDLDKAQPLADAYLNVTLVPRTGSMPLAPEPLDVVFSVQNYHDLYQGAEGAAGAAALNKFAFDQLKPGGHYVVVDHAGLPGTASTQTATLHRIEMSTARAAIEAAGFVLVDSSDLLRNPADPKTAVVSDPTVVGQTDQFMLKFRKPR